MTTDSPTNLPANKDAATDPLALNSIMQSLQRLIKIGIYYPSGHSVLDRATEQFRHNMIRVAGGNSFIRFTIKENTIYLQDIALDDTKFFVQEFKETLSSLSVKNLDIDREITSAEIHAFVRSLLACRAKFKSTKQFVRINLEDLPFSIRIYQTEYLAKEIQQPLSDHSSDEPSPTFEGFLESLNRQEFTKEQKQLCRQLLETASSSSLLLGSQKTESPMISWSDVERLIINLVKRSSSADGQQEIHYQRDLNAFASILNTLAGQGENKKSTQAINLLVSLVKRDAQESEGDQGSYNKKNDPGRETPSDETVSNIEHFIKENHVHAVLLKPLMEEDRCEMLTIVMQLLQSQHSLHVQVRIQQIIRDILTTSMTDSEWQILAMGVHQILEKIDSDDLPIPLIMIIDPLRRSQHVSSLVLIEHVCRNCTSVELKKILPYLMNEILVVGSQDNPEIFNSLCDIALFLPSSDITEAIPTLEKLDAFIEGKIAPNLFFSMSVANYSLFSPLLNTTKGELLAKRIFQGFKNNPPGWIIEALFPLLDSNLPLHRKFLFEFLNNTRFSEPTNTMKTLAAQIVGDTLLEIDDEKRKDLAIIKTIKAISQLGSPETYKVLKTIIGKKRFLILPEWPAQCRQAARETLSIIDSRIRSVR